MTTVPASLPEIAQSALGILLLLWLLLLLHALRLRGGIAAARIAIGFGCAGAAIGAIAGPSLPVVGSLGVSNVWLVVAVSGLAMAVFGWPVATCCVAAARTSPRA